MSQLPSLASTCCVKEPFIFSRLGKGFALAQQGSNSGHQPALFSINWEDFLCHLWLLVTVNLSIWIRTRNHARDSLQKYSSSFWTCSMWSKHP